MISVSSLSYDVGKKPACEALQVPRATFYRHHNSKYKQTQHSTAVRPQPPQALDPEEKLGQVNYT